MMGISQSIRQILAPISDMDANQADSNVSMLKKALAEINHQYRGLLSKTAYEEKAELTHELYSNLAYISGALAFLQIQNSGADSYLNRGEVRQDTLILSSQSCGIAIAHIRREKQPITAHISQGNIILNGYLPWASGYKIYDKVLLGFHLEGEEVIVCVDFLPQEGFEIGTPMQSIAASGINTVSMNFNQYAISIGKIVTRDPLGTFQAKFRRSKMLSMLHGIAMKAVTLIPDYQSQSKKILSNQCDVLRRQILSDMDPVIVRLNAFKLTQHVINLACLSVGGASTLVQHDLQRLYREAFLFSISGVSPEIVDAYISENNAFTIED